MKLHASLAAAAVYLAAIGAAPVAALTIDNFEVGDFSVSDDSTTSTNTVAEQTGLPGVMGGVRLVTAKANGATTISANAQLNTTDELDDGVSLTVLGAPDATGLFEFIYDGRSGATNNNFTGALNVSLNQPGLSRFEIATTGLTGTVTAKVTMWGNVRRDSAFVPLVANGVTSIGLDGFAGLDLGDVKTIMLTINGVEILDTPIITSFVVVPEPGTALLLAAGLTGLALRRPRQRTRSC